MINKILFTILISLALNLNLFSWDNSYAEYMPYFPYSDGKPVYDDSALSKVSYNLSMHNYPEACKLFQKQTKLVTPKSVNNIDLVSNFPSQEFSSQAGLYTVYLPFILEKMYIIGDSKNLEIELSRFLELNDVIPEKLYFFRCYMLFKNKEIVDFNNLYSEIESNNRIDDLLSYKSISDTEAFEIEYCARLLYEKYNDIDKALQILEDSLELIPYTRTSLLIAKLKAKIDKQEAVNYLENQLDLFFTDEYFGHPIRAYVYGIERLRMFLSFLCYGTGNNEKALEHFHLAVDSKMSGSTFLGDWNYWLNNRDYEEGEYEVMLKLKDMYINQYK
jgi:tetratricopeptide (TPR) repeat protein